MANVQGTLMTILHPQPVSPSADVQVTTVRMYLMGKAGQHICVLHRLSKHTMRRGNPLMP